MSINSIFSTQPAKIKASYSDKNNIEYGVWQCSNLAPLLLNIDLTDLFFECDESEIASCVDDTPP